MNRPGRVAIEQIESRALAGNRMGDPHVRQIPVYLPPGYDAGHTRYPVIYWLHGFTGIGLSAINQNPWVPSLPECMDRVLAAGAPPAILVMVDGFTKFGGSQYLNSDANGRYEDFTAAEVVEYIDGRYRTLPSAAHRGIDGKSSGGYGALVLAMRHPDVFGGVASHSGDVFFEACYKPDFWKFCDTVAKHGGVDAFLRAFLAMPKKTDAAITAAEVAAMAMAYSPNANRPPFFFDLPFDTHTGALNDAVWQRWRAWDPVVMVERYADNLRRLRLIYFECGSRDQFHLHLGARQLHERLGQFGITHEYQEFDDNHSAVNYRYVESLRRLCEALAGPHGG